MKRAALLIGAALAGCDDPDPHTTAPDLESAAIERGVVRDPALRDPTGLYARESDRLCIVADGDSYRMGVHIDHGPAGVCSAAGSARRTDDGLAVELGPDCRFDVRLIDDRATFPANLPEGCSALCSGRASLSAYDAGRLSASPSEAAAMRGQRGTLPCRTN